MSVDLSRRDVRVPEPLADFISSDSANDYEFYRLPLKNSERTDLDNVFTKLVKKPVYFGDTIDCSLTITKIDAQNWASAEVIYRNQDGTVVLEADLAGILPGDRERKVLDAILAGAERNLKK